MKLNELEFTILRELTHAGIPAYVLATVLHRSAPQIAYLRKKHGLQPGKGTAYARNFSLYIGANEFPILQGDYRRRYQALWEKSIREAAEQLCTAVFTEEDTHPIDVLRFYRNLLPTSVLQEFLGLTEKRFLRLCHAIRAMPSPALRRKLALIAHSDQIRVDTSSLSLSQQVRLDNILAKKREAYRRLRAQGMERRASQLWVELLGKRPGNKAPKVLCRGAHCKKRSENTHWKWPRTSEFFYKTTDTPDGLAHFCKYCQLRNQQAKRGVKTLRRHAKTVPPKEAEQIVTLLKNWKGRVPTLYIEKLFQLTRKQYMRFYRLAGLNSKHGCGQRRLWEWRQMEEESFPKLAGLSTLGLETLKKIWRDDIAEWNKVLEVEESLLLKTMREEDARIEALQEVNARASERRVRRKCKGTCGCSWHNTRLHFPPTFKRYHGFCHICMNRACRKQPDEKGAR